MSELTLCIRNQYVHVNIRIDSRYILKVEIITLFVKITKETTVQDYQQKVDVDWQLNLQSY